MCTKNFIVIAIVVVVFVTVIVIVIQPRKVHSQRQKELVPLRGSFQNFQK